MATRSTDIARHVAPGEQVARAGELLALPQPVYLMLNKPCGLLSATTTVIRPR